MYKSFTYYHGLTETMSLDQLKPSIGKNIFIALFNFPYHILHFKRIARFLCSSLIITDTAQTIFTAIILPVTE